MISSVLPGMNFFNEKSLEQTFLDCTLELRTFTPETNVHAVWRINGEIQTSKQEAKSEESSPSTKFRCSKLSKVTDLSPLTT